MWRIELDATADQQVKIANIAKAAIGDLRAAVTTIPKIEALLWRAPWRVSPCARLALRAQILTLCALCQT
jgi:hypothetical protein